MALLKLAKDIMNYAANELRTTAVDVDASLTAYKIRNETLRSQQIFADERYSALHEQSRRERELALAQYIDAKAQKYSEWRASKSTASLHEYIRSTNIDPRFISESSMISKQIYTKYL